MSHVAIRDAATVIVLRDIATTPKVLMGQRGSRAAFMPNKFVFPGGAVDADDAKIDLTKPPPQPCHNRLFEDAAGPTPSAIAAAAIRELWEETGLILGQPGNWTTPPADWHSYAARGFRPAADNLHFFFRAITPPGRPRRFDARFFITDAENLCTDPDDFSAACDELSHLQWVPLAQVRELNLPFITTVVLGEVAAVTDVGPPATVPFFKNTDEASLFARLGAKG